MAIPTLGTYYTINMLVQAKWPRKVGLQKKPVYSSEILNIVTCTMVDWASAVGAGSPFLAEMILNTYSLESGQEVPAIETVLRLRDKVHKKLSQKGKLPAPHDIVPQVSIVSTHRGNVPAGVISKVDTMVKLEKAFTTSLLLGYCTPKYVLDWYKQDYLESKRDKDKYEMIGMNVSDLPELDDWLQNAQDIVNLYKEETNDSLSRDYEGFTPILRELRKESKTRSLNVKNDTFRSLRV